MVKTPISAKSIIALVVTFASFSIPLAVVSWLWQPELLPLLAVFGLFAAIAGGSMSMAIERHKDYPNLAGLRRSYWVAQGVLALAISGSVIACIVHEGFSWGMTIFALFTLVGGIVLTRRGVLSVSV